MATNELVGHLRVDEPCVVLVERDDATSLVVYDGEVAYACSEFLEEVEISGA